MGYNKSKREKHLFEKEPEYLLKYLDMLKRREILEKLWSIFYG